MYKELQISKGYMVIVDDEDYDYLMQWKWYASKTRSKYRTYAVRNTTIAERLEGMPTTVYMHREVINCFGEFHVDHINGNTLDNRKENLRICKNADNLKNRGKATNNTSGYKGVHRFRNKWQAQIMANGKRFHLGLFDTPEEAYKAYCKAAEEYHGEFAKTE